MQRGHRERAKLSRLDVRQRGRHAREKELHLAAEEISDRRSSALVRHMDQVHAREETKLLGGKMLRTAGS